MDSTDRSTLLMGLAVASLLCGCILGPLVIYLARKDLRAMAAEQPSAQSTGKLPPSEAKIRTTRAYRIALTVTALWLLAIVVNVVGTVVWMFNA